MTDHPTTGRPSQPEGCSSGSNAGRASDVGECGAETGETPFGHRGAHSTGQEVPEPGTGGDVVTGRGRDVPGVTSPGVLWLECTREPLPPLLLRRTVPVGGWASDEKFWDGEWVPTRLIMQWLGGHEDFTDKIDPPPMCPVRGCDRPADDGRVFCRLHGPDGDEVAVENVEGGWQP